jgi:tryptophanyl-tRNA synthetase
MTSSPSNAPPPDKALPNTAAPPRPVVSFSGIQPSGEMHIGNYYGAVRPMVQQVERRSSHTPETLLYCLVDAHAITVPYKPKDLQKRVFDLAADMLACGLDTNKCTLFVQSDVPEHMELAWYLATVTPMGDLSRMTQFKDKSDGQEFISTGLFTYPVLMSADILLYKATVVPVGDDQMQHLELARETARRFNHRFGRVFPEPQGVLSAAPRIMGVDGHTKMSKSKGNSIGVFEEPKAFWNKLKSAYTDPQRVQRTDPGRPEVCNMYTLHKAVSSEENQALVRQNCTTAGWGCFDCKKLLHDTMETDLVQLRKRKAELSPESVHAALKQGQEQARERAARTMKQVRSAMGLGSSALSTSG